jgi:2-polyprenyl-3-methyl-5-hydroxy-6-metoxy-1,4-benzoquinol methylase
MKKEIAQIILDKTRKNYDSIASHFSQTREKLWADFNFFKKYLRPGERILDIGCGNGRLYELFKDKNINYLGVDVSVNLINEAQKKYPEIASSFQIGDILNLSLEKSHFDKIFCVAVFHHLPSVELRLRALLNLKQLLKDDGLLFLTCWNLYNPRYLSYILKRSFLKFFPKIIIPGVRSTNLDFKDVFIPWKKTQDGRKVLRYCHAFTLGELAKLVKEAGFRITDQFYTKEGKISTLWRAHNLILICKSD